ncbi:ribonuclease P protein component [uncultured Sphingomonas sp.]|uniref:ribonuclease P protein component n=1 Tax=uncultured Sphingomonas sp. TaxID=158754 RepID=UPI00374829FA
MSHGALARVTARADYLKANGGRRAAMPGFVLLVYPRNDGDPTPRIGITVSKKVDSRAVVRNRMKRRFRALAREVLASEGIAGADHILIGRGGAGIERSWDDLRADLVKAIRKAAPR